MNKKNNFFASFLLIIVGLLAVSFFLFSYDKTFALQAVPGEWCGAATVNLGSHPECYFTDCSDFSSCNGPCCEVKGGGGGGGGGGGITFTDNSSVQILSPSVLPSVLSPGEKFNFQIKVTNTGTTDWYNGSYYQFVQKTSLSLSPTYGHIPYAVFPFVALKVPSSFATLFSAFLPRTVLANAPAPGSGSGTTGCYSASSESEACAGINDYASCESHIPPCIWFDAGGGDGDGGGGGGGGGTSFNYVIWDFNLTAPMISGDYTLDLQMVHKAGALYKINSTSMQGPASDTFFGQVGEINFTVPGSPVSFCAINSFSADNTNLAYNTGTNLHYSLEMYGSYNWAISLLQGGVLPNPDSGSGKDETLNGTSTTGNLTGTQIYRLTCGTDTEDLTVDVESPTCANGATNPPTCNVFTSCANGATNPPDCDTFPPCGNGATNPPDCSVFQINGVCAATHFDCVSGDRANQGADSTKWTWSCNGSGGGTNASCSESKSVPVNGSCSSTHYNCSIGTSASNVNGVSAWTWDCNGSNGGTNASCSENKLSEAQPSGNISATSCAIASDESTCDSFVSWDTENLTSGETEVTRSNPTIRVSHDISGTNIRNTIHYGIDGRSTFFLYHNIDGTPTKLAEATVTASCGAGTIWDGSICKIIPGGLSGTLTPEVPSCKIASGKNSCKINFSWNTEGTIPGGTVSAVTTDYPSANTHVSVPDANSGTNVPFVVQYNIQTFYLYNTRELAQSTVTSDCVSGTEWKGGKCMDIVLDVCLNGATNWPACTIGGDGECLNGTINPPLCTIGGGGCVNGATNPPVCTLNNGGGCVNGATNPPLCTIGGGGECLNGTVNPPLCTLDGGGGCINSATNPPLCTIDGTGKCLNSAINPPSCTQPRIPTFKED